MPQGGHNRVNGGTVEAARSLDVMALARAGYVGGGRLGGWQWTYATGDRASILIFGGTDRITLNYRCRGWNTNGWQDVEQRMPIVWTPCRFGGRRPWFLCACSSNGRYCGRKVVKLYGAGRLFACRHCWRLVYAVQWAMRWIGDTADLASCIGSWGPITIASTLLGRTSRSGCGRGHMPGC